jgi:AraC-like DNA-binding protein
VFKGYNVDLNTVMYASKIAMALLFLGTATYLYSNKNIMYNIPDYLKPQNKKNKKNKEKIDIAHIFKIVNEIVIKEQLYTKKDFNLINLSVKTGIKPRELTLTISENGFANFSAYSNHFKVEKAKALMEIGFLENYSIEALAEKSGFGASNSFYRIFKNATGITPNQYAKRLKTNDEG